MSAVGKALRTLRYARARAIEDAAADADMSPLRLRRLEHGTAQLEYLEGIRLAKALDLCPNCFRRVLEAAADRDAASVAAPEAGAVESQPAVAGPNAVGALATVNDSGEGRPLRPAGQPDAAVL